MSYDSVIVEIGTFGWWQATILAALSLPDIFYAFALLLPVFIGATPDFTCAEKSYAGNSINGTQVYVNATSPVYEASGDACKSCSEFQYDDAYTSIVTQWDLVCDMDYVSDLITTIQMAGLLVGAAVLGQISDTFGRKKAYFAVNILLVGAGFASGFSPNWYTFAVMRFFVGISAGGYFCVNCVYPLEFVGARWRTLCGTIGFWAIGEMLLALMAYFIRGWRLLTIISSAVSGITFFVLWIVPESPRWLAQQHRTQEAKDIFAKIAKRNKRPVPDMSALDDLGLPQTETKAGTKKVKTCTYKDLFLPRSLALRTCIILLTWFTVFIAYYELSYNMKNLSGDRYFNMFLAGLFDLAAMLVVISLNNHLGRKKLQAALLVVAVASNAAILILDITNEEDKHATLFKMCAMIGKGAALAGTYVIQIFTAELYPTCIRNLACGAGSSAARVGALCAPQIIYLGTRFSLAPYLVIISLCALTLPLTFVLPETNGKPLEDSIEKKVCQDQEIATADQFTSL